MIGRLIHLTLKFRMSQNIVSVKFSKTILMFEVFPNTYSESVFLKVLCNFIDPNEHLKWDKLQ